MGPRGPRILQEAPGSPRKPQEAPRRPRRLQEAPRSPRRLQEAPMKSQVLGGRLSQEALRLPRNPTYKAQKGLIKPLRATIRLLR